jgi:hypothetical protein
MGTGSGAGVGIGSGAATSTSAGVGISPSAGTLAQRSSATRGAPLQQRLLYLLVAAARGLRICAWVGQSGPRGSAKHSAATAAVQPFSFRSSLGGTDFPRYVDVNDKDILKALNAMRAEASGDLGGAWDVSGEPASAAVRQIVATGRAYWQSLRGQPLSAGTARHAIFAWKALSNGDQRLHCEVATAEARMSNAAAGMTNAEASTSNALAFLDVEPAIYIDSESAEIGPLELAHPLSVIRRYWQQPPVAPEEVIAANERICDHAPFPTLQIFPVQRQPLSSLAARLDLSAGPRAILHFVYNGLQVDSQRLQDEHAAVRQMMNGTLYELPRDQGLERQWRARIASLGWSLCWTRSPRFRSTAGKSPSLTHSPTASPKWTTGMGTWSRIVVRDGLICDSVSSWKGSTSTCCPPLPATFKRLWPVATKRPWQRTRPSHPILWRATPVVG